MKKHLFSIPLTIFVLGVCWKIQEMGCLPTEGRDEEDQSSWGEDGSSSIVATGEEDEALTEERKQRDVDYKPLALPPGYNKLGIPLSENGSRVRVYVSLFIRTILDVDVGGEELIVDADFGMRWVDWKIIEHLNEVDWRDPQTGVKLGNRTLDPEILHEIWKPDVFIDEMSRARKSSILKAPITVDFLGDTGPSSSDRGDIIYSSRNTFRLRCDMSFEFYPADTQKCEYYVRSYSYPVSQLALYWEGDTGIYLDDPNDPNFDLMIESAEPHRELEDLYIEEKFDIYRRANYSALRFVLKARRRLSYHIVQTYLPSVLFVLITWLCFLIPPNLVEVRIGISMTTLLTLVAMFGAVRSTSPEVSYTMAIDVWMVFSIFFVFIALCLFTFIHWISLRMLKNSSDNNNGGMLDGPSSPPQPKLQYLLNFSQHHAFWSFSTVYFIFCIIYWAWLLTVSEYFAWAPHPEFNAEGDVSEGDHDRASNLYRYHETRKSAP